MAFTRAENFGTALITFGTWRKLSDYRLRIQEGGRALDVTIRPTGGKIRIGSCKIREDATAGRTPTRIAIDFIKTRVEGSITLIIAPAEN
jgi:hypothetical protein